MRYTRRQFVFATVAMPLMAVGLTGCNEWNDVKARIHLARRSVDTINSNVATLVAGSITQDQKDKLVKLQTQIDQLDDALQKISESEKDKTDVRAPVSQLITWINQVLAIAAAIPAMPPQTKGILVIVQLALVFIQQAVLGSGPGVLENTADPDLLAEASKRFNAASDKKQLAQETDKAINEWLANQAR